MTKDVQTIFQEFIQKKNQVFKNREMLNSHFTPNTIPYRDTQINVLASILAPSLKNSRPSNIFIYGMTGTGKTLVSKFVTNELERMSAQNNTQIKILYVNCKMKKVADTEYRLIAELTRMLGQEIPITGLPTKHVYQTFFNIVDSKDWCVVIILDEIDYLVEKMGDGFLYNLTRINQELVNSKVSILGITNDLNFIDILDPRVKSSLGEEEILFTPYNAVELQEILKQRSAEGFIDGVLSEEVIPKCAALAAQEHGDARRALDLLRIAGELCERENEKQITEKHVDTALEKIDYDRVTEVVKSLPKQSKLVLWSIINLVDNNHEDIQTGDVYGVYEEKCKSCGLHPLTQRRLSDLISELDMMGIINAKVISMGRYGRTRKITLSVSLNIKQKIIEKLESTLTVC